MEITASDEAVDLEIKQIIEQTDSAFRQDRSAKNDKKRNEGRNKVRKKFCAKGRSERRRKMIATNPLQD